MDEQGRWQRATKLLQATSFIIKKGAPDVLEMSVLRADMIQMYWRCVSTFEAIGLLCTKQFGDEASQLCRSLVTESLWLMELALMNEKERSAVLLHRASESVTRMEANTKKAVQYGRPGDHQEFLETLAKQRRKIQQWQRQAGVRKLKSFDSEETLMVRHYRTERLLDFLFSHQFVHGSPLALSFRREILDQQVATIANRTIDLDLLSAITCTACLWVLDAYEATARIFRWTVPPQFQQLYEAVTQLDRELEIPEE